MKNVFVLPHQGYYMQAPQLFPDKRYFFLVCGYGAGKTQANVFAVLLNAKRLQGKKDRAGNYARIMVCGVTLSHLEKTFLIYFRRLLDMSKTAYTESKKYNTFRIGTVTVILQPLENPGDIFGYDAHRVYVEEIDELTADKMFEAVKSLNERCRQIIPGERSPCLCFASTSQGQKGLYAVYNHFKKSGVGFVLIRGRTQDNPYLPRELVRDMVRTYTPEEREVFMDGKFLAIAKGRVLPGFDWERNYASYDLDNKLLPDETVLIGQDINTGYSRASAYVVRDGVIYAVKYYDFPDLMDAPRVFRYDFPTQKILWVPDVTIKDSFPAYGSELRKYNIKIIYRKKSPSVEDSCFLVSKLFYLGRLVICKAAKDLAEACSLAMRDNNNKIPKGIGNRSPIHAIDGARYVCTFAVVKFPGFEDVRRLIVDKRASLRNEPDEDLVKNLGSGYVEISPEAFKYAAPARFAV